VTEAQVFSRQWAPPTGVLGRILAETAQRVAAISAADRDAIERRASVVARAPSFIDAMRGSTVAVIAEMKRRSPSKGAIRESIAAELQGMAYERGGASAISVLTEPLRFGGNVADLESTRARVGIPLLRKDFHIEELQLHEARAAGASAVLLIVRALSPEKLAAMIASATSLELEPLVEVHTQSELALAIELGARVIGINSRDLETLNMDAHVPERLLGLVPVGTIAIAESGIESRADVEVRASWGADAVLIGSALSASGDPESAVRALTRVARSGRAH
jgi:indole-3-glycerol phosphate synthase